MLYTSSYEKMEKKTMDILDADTWGEYWQSSNKSYGNILKNDKDYERFLIKCSLFRINDRFTTWVRNIDRLHGEDEKGYYFADCIMLKSTCSVAITLNAIYNVNMYVSCSDVPCFFNIYIDFIYQIIHF